MAFVWPDGSSLTIGASGVPSLTRHTVDGDQNRVATPFTQAERVASAPGAFPFTYTQSTGTKIIVNSTGSVTVSGTSGQTINVTGDTINVGAGGETLQAAVLNSVWTWLQTHVHTGVTTGAGRTWWPGSVPVGWCSR